MQAVLAHHDSLMRMTIEANGGYIFKTIGDAFCAGFPSAVQALQAAIDAQQTLSSKSRGQSPTIRVEETADGEQTASRDEPEINLRVRMALHTGAAEVRDGDYFGPTLNRVARLLAAGHGGQVLLSLATEELVRGSLPEGVRLLDFGERRLKDLTKPEQVFQLVVPGLTTEFPPLKTLDARPSNLPVQPSQLIGREKELGEAYSLLRRPGIRLVTFTGPGGTGKTRLALQVAADMLDEFDHGVAFVNLAPITDPGLVVTTIAQTMGVKEAANQPILETLKSYLSGREMLLLLDNYEQIADDAAPYISELLSAAARLKVLVTSREPLKVRGEHEYLVPPLSLPDPRHISPPAKLMQYEAVRLFVERAAAVKHDFRVTADNASAVVEICARLDGLPLAIELAAARIRVLPPRTMLARLQSRLRFLTGSARDLPARQRTLRSTIEWSYDLLDEGEKQLFRRLAVFVGGRNLEAIEVVCSGSVGDVLKQGATRSHVQDNLSALQIDTLAGVESLVSQNLLRQDEGAGGEPRFVMLETIHEYAREKLEESGEVSALRRRHARYFMLLAEEAEPELRGDEQAAWLARLEEERGNMLSALEWSKGFEPGTEIRLVSALWRFWYVRGYLSEGLRWLESVLSRREGVTEAVRAGFVSGKIVLSIDKGDYAHAMALLEENLNYFRKVGDKQGIAHSLNYLGVVASYQGNYDLSRRLFTEGLEIRRELGEEENVAASLNNLAHVAIAEGDYESAQSFLLESLELFRLVGYRRGEAISLNNLGHVARHRLEYQVARGLYEESLSIKRELGDKLGIASSLASLGATARSQEDFITARALYLESLDICREVGERQIAASCLLGLADIEQAEGRLEEAAHLLGTMEALLEAVGAAPDVTGRAEHDRIFQSVRSQLDKLTWEGALSMGRARTVEQAIAAVKAH
jgi:predicted ATPase/class 3 adenylate cyclase